MCIHRPVIVVGGLPEPVGGVTGFVWALAFKNLVAEVIDLYPSPKKNIPKTYTGRVSQVSGVFGFLMYYFSNVYSTKDYIMHFNFSTIRSALLLILLPKRAIKFALMLHHGNLNATGWRVYLYKFALSRVDMIYSLSDKQFNFYLSLGVPLNKITKTSSYTGLCYDLSKVERQLEIDSYFQGGARILVASGYPSGIYNHEWCIQYCLANENCKLAIFLYGQGPEYSSLLSQANDSIRFFEGCSQDDFNYALSKSDLYLRPTMIDSFGVAVADAIQLGVPVVASDVCTRYPGARLFKTGSFNDFRQSVDFALSGKAQSYMSDSDFTNFSYSEI